MGINNGIYNGVGANPIQGQEFYGTVTMRPTVNPSTVALFIQDQAPGRSGVGAYFYLEDFFGAPIWYVAPSTATQPPHSFVGGDFLTAATSGGANFAIDGSKNPPALWDAQSGLRIYMGNLDPTVSSNYPSLTGVLNDWFWRFTGTTSTTHMYRCSTAGPSGTAVWTGFF